MSLGYRLFQFIQTVKGLFFNNMLADDYRWKQEGILSVLTQEEPKGIRMPSKLKVIDLFFEDT